MVVAYVWSLSSRRRNAAASHDSGNPSRTDHHTKAWTFTVLHQLRTQPRYGAILIAQRCLATEHMVTVNIKYLKRARARYEANG